MLEELRYESWECTDVVGVSRTEYVTVKIATNGTAFTRTGCFTTKLSEDLSYVQKFEHACGEEPTELTPDGSWYTNFRLNSSVVPAPATMTCVGAPVTLDTSEIAPYYEGVGSVASESSYVGDVYPPFESVNSNGLPDYSEAKGKPSLIDGLYYDNNEETEISSFMIRTSGRGIRAMVKNAGNATDVELAFLQSTGYEQVPPEQTYLTSFTWTPVTLNGTLDESTTYCGLIDSIDPYELGLAPKIDTPEGCSGLNAAEATIKDTRLLFFPPQVDIETASDAENAVLLSATAAELTGAKQSPPIDTPVTAAFYMNKPNEQGWVTFDLDVFDVVGLTMAHIHAGNSTTNGGY